MTLEQTLVQALGALVSGRAFPDVVPPSTAFPCITYQQVGGGAGWYADQSVPGKASSRIQVNVHSKTRLEANQLARQVERAIAAAFNESQPYGAFVAIYDDAALLYTTRQDFGIQFAVSL